MTKPKLEWAEKGEAEDFDAAVKFLSLLCLDSKAKALAPVLLVRGDMANGLPTIVADGYHRICAVCYFDESAPIPCRIADRGV